MTTSAFSDDDIAPFWEHLKQRITKSSRPFVCDGTPLKCRVFIVGYNPATAFDTPFSDHWHARTGFLRKRFLQDFRRQRNQLLKLRGTRARLETIVETFVSDFGSNLILETNIYSEPTATIKAHRGDDTRAFQFLLQRIRPDIMYVHSQKALRYFDVELTNRGFHEVSNFRRDLFDHPLRLFASGHLSRLSLDEAASIGARLARLLVSSPSTGGR
jgi:hypothetical protein